jgi:hypothetical protein
MRESAGHFDFGHFYFCPKMISSILSFSCDWKKIMFFIRIISKHFSVWFFINIFCEFFIYSWKTDFCENSEWTFFKFGSILYQEICKFRLKNTLQCCKGKSSKKSKPKYSEILEYFSRFFNKKMQIKHPTKI